MTIPLAEVHEDMWLDLKADRYADPHGSDPAFANPLVVWDVQDGPPTTKAEMSVTKVKYLGPGASKEADSRGISIIVSAFDGAASTLLYFPDDQHEVVSSDVSETNDNEEAEGKADREGSE